VQGTDGREGALRSIPLTDRLERTFSAQAGQLPRLTQAALLLIALDKDPTVGDVLDAVRKQLGERVTVDVLQPAVDEGLISIAGSRVSYRHPLMRSALDQAATAGQRRSAHLAFAEVIADPDRRAWHHAKAVLGEDEGAAADLEITAGRALDRGAPATALGALELAASLTPQGPDRARRLLAAAELAFQLGDPPAVGRLLDSVAGLELSPNDLARMTWLREIFHDGAPGDPNAIARLVGVAREAATGGDRNLSLNLLQGAALRCWWADPGPAAKNLVIDAVEQIAGDVLDPRALEILALAAPVDAASRIAARVREAAQVDDADPYRTQVLAFAAYAAGDRAESIELMDRAAPLLRAQDASGCWLSCLQCAGGPESTPANSGTRCPLWRKPIASRSRPDSRSGPRSARWDVLLCPACTARSSPPNSSSPRRSNLWRPWAFQSFSLKGSLHAESHT